MKMKNSIKNKVKIGIDILMTILIIFLMNTRFTGIQLHEIFGVVILVLFIIHKILNFQWIIAIGKNLFNKKVNTKNKMLFLLAIALFLLTIGMIITGILISRYLFTQLEIGNRGVIKKLHRFFSSWAFVLMAIHIGFHIQTIRNRINNKFISLKENRIVKVVILIGYIVIAIYAVLAFTKEGIYKNFIPNFSTLQKGKQEKTEERQNQQNSIVKENSKNQNNKNGQENKIETNKIKQENNENQKEQNKQAGKNSSNKNTQGKGNGQNGIGNKNNANRENGINNSNSTNSQTNQNKENNNELEEIENKESNQWDREKRQEENRKDREERTEQEDKGNLLDYISIIILFSGGTYSIIDFIDKKGKIKKV